MCLLMCTSSRLGLTLFWLMLFTPSHALPGGVEIISKASLFFNQRHFRWNSIALLKPGMGEATWTEPITCQERKFTLYISFLSVAWTHFSLYSSIWTEVRIVSPPLTHFVLVLRNQDVVAVGGRKKVGGGDEAAWVSFKILEVDHLSFKISKVDQLLFITKYTIFHLRYRSGQSFL